MPRGRKKKTDAIAASLMEREAAIAAAIEKAEAELKAAKLRLADLKKQQSALLAEKEAAALKELKAAVEASGKSVEDFIQSIKG